MTLREHWCSPVAQASLTSTATIPNGRWCWNASGRKVTTPIRPVVIVQHGASRNGAEYYAAWIPAAEQHGLLIVAITFPKDAWSDVDTYNNGHVFDEDGSLRPRECWSQAIPGRVFALLREGGITRRD